MSEQDRSQDTSPESTTAAQDEQRPDARNDGERKEDARRAGADRSGDAESSDARPESPEADAADQESADAGSGRAEAADGAQADLGARVERLTEALARSQAEMVNQERRLEREMDKARKFALERVMRDFVPVLDSLDQAMESVGDGDGSSAVEGLALTRKLALKVLEAHGLETIDPAGKPFDPSWHEAMTAVPSEDAEPDSVIEVLQKGYALNGRLLRPARVVVAKAP
ncbi:nucleotide exchange factor GrpE [Halomonas denitrificans]|nr:nucleotide exchange factor GrpE [Halomonas denitrificans]